MRAVLHFRGFFPKLEFLFIILIYVENFCVFELVICDVLSMCKYCSRYYIYENIDKKKINFAEMNSVAQ